MEKIETIVSEILGLKKQIHNFEEEVKVATQKQDSAITEHKLKILKLKEDIENISEPIMAPLGKVIIDIQSKESELIEFMTSHKEKTIKLDQATVKIRTTKSVKILDKVELVRTLAKIPNGIEKGIKTFALLHIRKLMETDAIPPELADFEESTKVDIIENKGD